MGRYCSLLQKKKSRTKKISSIQSTISTLVCISIIFTQFAFLGETCKHCGVDVKRWIYSWPARIDFRCCSHLIHSNVSTCVIKCKVVPAGPASRHSGRVLHRKVGPREIMNMNPEPLRLVKIRLFVLRGSSPQPAPEVAEFTANALGGAFNMKRSTFTPRTGNDSKP